MPTKFVDLVEEKPNTFKLLYKAIKCLILPRELKWMTRIIAVFCFLYHLNSRGKYTQVPKEENFFVDV